MIGPPGSRGQSRDRKAGPKGRAGPQTHFNLDDHERRVGYHRFDEAVAELTGVRKALLGALANGGRSGVGWRGKARASTIWRLTEEGDARMSSATLALAASPVGVRSRTAWRVLLAFAGSWLVAALAQLEFKLPFTPVPITGQTLGVLLVGASLGSGLGAVSLALYLAQGAVGLPFFSGGDSGVEFLRLSAATGGYIWGFIASAAVVGALSERRWDRSIRSSIGEMFLGELVLYAIAIPWLMQALDVPLGEALELGFAPFVIGDILKLLGAAGLLPLAWRVVEKRSR